MIQENKNQLYVSNSSVASPLAQIHFSASRYQNNLILVVNQTGTIGSILQAQLQSESIEDPIYEITTKFGATDSEFYQILFRRILDVVYVDLKTKKQVLTTLIISLPLKNKQFNEKDYYDLVYQGIKKEILQVA